MRCLLNNLFESLFSSVYFPGQFTFQVGGFILVNDATFGQFVDHTCYVRQLIRHLFSVSRFQVADSITGGFAVKFISFAAFA